MLGIYFVKVNEKQDLLCMEDIGLTPSKIKIGFLSLLQVSAKQT